MDIRRVVAGIGRTCIASGVLILLFVAYQLWGTGLAESRSQDRLRGNFLDDVPSRSATSTTTPNGAATTTTELPPVSPEGEAVAIIRIPKIGVDKAVVEGVGLPDLKKGPGHYPGTPMPGQPGNASIAGHRTTYGAPFFRLEELQPGDPVFVTTRQGQFKYRVRTSLVVKPTQKDVLDPTDDNRLTLTTCNPRFSASQRLIVVSDLVTDAAPAPPPIVTPAGEIPKPVELGASDLSGTHQSRWPALGWALLAALVWLVTWLLSKRWGRLSAYAMGVPVFLVVLFIFFENFARVLPGNF